MKPFNEKYPTYKKREVIQAIEVIPTKKKFEILTSDYCNTCNTHIEGDTLVLRGERLQFQICEQCRKELSKVLYEHAKSKLL